MTNAQGRTLLNFVEDFGGIILNGRTTGDTDGEYSFCGAMGSSVIDYFICSWNLLQYVQELTIPTKIYSDHMPVCLGMRIPSIGAVGNAISPWRRMYWDDRYCAKYNINLRNSVERQHPDNSSPINEGVLSLTNMIRSARPDVENRRVFEPTQRWFDWACYRQRKLVRKYFRRYKESHNEENRRIYYSSRAKFRRLCARKKLEYHNDNLGRLDNVSNSKEWWDLSNSLRKRNPAPRGNLTADEFLVHFSAAFRAHCETEAISWCMPYFINPLLDSPFEFCELNAVVANLKDNKTPGFDGVPYEFYKHAPYCFLDRMLGLFNKIFITESIPTAFRTSILLPIHKKGDPNTPANYRGLSLINSMSKIFCNILLNRLSDWLDYNSILNEFQAGFRRNYSTVDNIFNLANIVHINRLNKKTTYAFFVDFSTAFDTIPRNSLFYKLSCMGISSKIVRILRLLYEGTDSKIWDGTYMSESFVMETGVKQGCVLSPVLFSLYLNDLPEVLPGGVRVAGTTIRILLYADDIVLLSDCPDGLQGMIDTLEGYCATWGLSVNLLKSKVLVFRKCARIASGLKWIYRGQDIEIVNSYTYLGLEMTYNLSFRKHLGKRLASSKIAVASTWSTYISNPRISRENKLKIFEACCRSIMFYAAQVWGFVRYDDVEKLLRFYVKKLFYLPSNTPNYMIHLETGIKSMYVSTLQMHLKYVDRVLRLGPNRLPRILAEEVIRSGTYWAEEWTTLCDHLRFHPSTVNGPLCRHWREITRLLETCERYEFESGAHSSQFHDLYPKLNYDGSLLMMGDLSTRAVGLIIRARGGLLDLNARCFKNHTDGICTICNLDAPENTLHFIGCCPIYNEFRTMYFGKSSLTEIDVLQILNGTNYSLLYNFLETCIKYRNMLLNEFN